MNQEGNIFKNKNFKKLERKMKQEENYVRMSLEDKEEDEPGRKYL